MNYCNICYRYGEFYDPCENCRQKNIMDYLEKSLGDTVERKDDRFIIKPIYSNVGFKFGNGFLINNYKSSLEKENNDI